MSIPSMLVCWTTCIWSKSIIMPLLVLTWFMSHRHMTSILQAFCQTNYFFEAVCFDKNIPLRQSCIWSNKFCISDFVPYHIISYHIISLMYRIVLHWVMMPGIVSHNNAACNWLFLYQITSCRTFIFIFNWLYAPFFLNYFSRDFVILHSIIACYFVTSVSFHCRVYCISVWGHCRTPQHKLTHTHTDSSCNLYSFILHAVDLLHRMRRLQYVNQLFYFTLTNG